MFNSVDKLKSWLTRSLDDLEKNAGEFGPAIKFMRATWDNIDGAIIFVLCALQLWKIAFVFALVAALWGIRKYMKEHSTPQAQA